MTGGGCTASHAGSHLVSSEPSATQWACTYQNTTGADHFIHAHAICARVPGR